jgi:thymidylate synthase
MQIRCKTIAAAHNALCREIFEGGDEIITEDGEVTFEYPEPVLVIVVEPLAEPRISSICGFGEKAFDKYTHDLLHGSENDFAYTYHERLFEYKTATNEYMGNINQIESIIYKLNRKPNSRRAQAITWMPSIDINSDNPPCLQRIQCLIRDGKLHMDVNFRSNDCLSAFGQNAYALTFLQKMIADELGVPVGRYTHYITSAHIYFERDAEELKRLKEVMYYG